MNILTRDKMVRLRSIVHHPNPSEREFSMKLILLPIAAIFFLASCSNSTHRGSLNWNSSPDPMVTRSLELRSSINQCYERLRNSPSMQILDGKIAPKVDDQPLAILSSNQKPTQKEKEALVTWDKERSECQKYEIEHVDTMVGATNLKAVLMSAQAQLRADTADLYSGVITYGQFAKKRQVLAARVREAQANVIEQNNRKNDAEARANQQLQIQQQQIDAQNRAISNQALIQGANVLNTVNTPPPRVPTTVNCNSTRVGNSVNTTCY